MKKIFLLAVTTLLAFQFAFSQRITLYGKLSGDDFKLVERAVSDIFSQTNLLNIPLYHDNTLLTKLDRNNLPDFNSIAGYYSFNETFVESMGCFEINRIVGQRSNNSAT